MRPTGRQLFHTQLVVGSIPIIVTNKMWATQYIEQLKQGLTVKFRPHGNSMQGRIESGQLVTVVPAFKEYTTVAHTTDIAEPDEGDIVLCKVEGRQWLHLVSAIGSDGRYQISNNKGHINGWCTKDNIFGMVVYIED